MRAKICGDGSKFAVSNFCNLDRLNSATAKSALRRVLVALNQSLSEDTRNNGQTKGRRSGEGGCRSV